MVFRTLSFVITLIISSFFIIINGIPFMFPNKKYINNIINNWYSFLMILMSFFYNINIYITYDFFEFMNEKNDFILISNHYTEIDYLFLLILQSFRNPNTKLTIMLKNSLRYIFLSLGWACWLNDFIFVKRNFEKDKKYILNKVNKKDNKNILIFPEGTVNCDCTYLKNIEFCKDNNIEPFEYLLHPKIKGCELIQPLLESKIVYDCTIFYDSMPIKNRKHNYTLKNIILNNILPKNVFIDISKNNIELNKENLFKIFKEKNENIKNFYENKNKHYIKLEYNGKDIMNAIFNIVNCFMGIFFLFYSNFYVYYVIIYIIIINLMIFIDDMYNK